MLDSNMVLGWEEVTHDLYEENGYVFGIELDLFNGYQVYYAKSTDKNGKTYYCDLSDDIYKAIKEFNKIVAMKDKRQEYIEYFTRMQEEDNKFLLGGMAWDGISWWIYNATEKDKLFTKNELADMFPDLLGYLKNE